MLLTNFIFQGKFINMYIILLSGKLMVYMLMTSIRTLTYRLQRFIFTYKLRYRRYQWNRCY